VPAYEDRDRPHPIDVERTTLLVGAPASEALAELLRASGIRVLTATSAEEALGVLMRHAVDCLVAGATLPGLSGAELLNEIRLRGDPPVLILDTEHGSAGARTRWIEAGATDCVDGRTSVDIVAARCAAILRRRRIGA
jgi:DNA-binding response OmpR family regulator